MAGASELVSRPLGAIEKALKDQDRTPDNAATLSNLLDRNNLNLIPTNLESATKQMAEARATFS